MQRTWLMALCVLLAGCSIGASVPRRASEAPVSSKQTTSASTTSQQPPVPPEVERPGTGALPIETGTAEQLRPFFQSGASQFPGVFVSKGDTLAYVVSERRVVLPMGAGPTALLANESAALLSDAQRLYWFEPNTERLTPIPGLPSVRKAVWRGDTFLLVSASNEVLIWKPGGAPIRLERPENLFGVAGVSLSPDVHYAVVVYDIDLPGASRVSTVWVWDLQSGRVFKQPDPPPALAGGYGLWLLGWSGANTLRFEVGVREIRGGQTWRLDQSEPSSDGTQYRMMEDAVLSPDGSWFVYRPIPEQAVVQSVQPNSKPVGLPFPRSGAYGIKILLNGHLAAHDASGWLELLPDGSLRRWDGVDAIY